MSIQLNERPVEKSRAGSAIFRSLQAPVMGALAGAAGLLGAAAPVFAGLRPLGLCFAAALPMPYGLPCAAGAAVGYFLALQSGGAAPYLISAAALALLRPLAGRREGGASMLPAAAAAICLCLTKAAFALTGSTGLAGVLAGAAEALLVLGVSYLLLGLFLHTAAGQLPQDSEGRAALCFGIMALVICLAPYRLLGVPLACAVGALAVLAAADRGKESDGAALGVGVAAALCAADPAWLFAGLGISAGGLAAGFYAGESRRRTAIVFCGGGFLGVFCAPSPADVLALTVALCLAGATYCLLPQRLLARLPAPAAAPFAARAARTELSGRLEQVSAALCAVGDTMRAVCKKIPPKGEGVSALCDTVAQRCCKSCGKREFCWVERGGETYNAFNDLAGLLARGEGIAAADLPLVLQRRCQTPVRLANALNVAAAEQAARRAARTQSTVTRAALCEQYSAMAAALGDLAGQVYRADVPDRRKARRVEQLFTQLGLELLEVSVTQDDAGRVTAAVCVPRMDFSDEERAMLSQEVGALCRRSFADARCEHTAGVTTLLFREKTRYTAAWGLCSLPAQGNVCADAAQVFFDRAGRLQALLCDGMGTGKAAAVGGRLAASLLRELLEAGFEPPSAVRLVNVALALKDGEESTAAIDALTLDLYTGGAALYKAGAAASYLLRNGRVEPYGADTLPVGILDSVTAHNDVLCLAPGDTVVLVSDGAAAPGGDWLRAQLAAHAADAPQQLADAVAQAARKKRSTMPDDITVLAVRLH